MAGPLFGVNPSTSAENAFDGDPTSAWTFGDFGRAPRAVRLGAAPQPLRVDRIDLDVPPTTGQRIAKVRGAGRRRLTRGGRPTGRARLRHVPRPFRGAI